MHKKYLSVLTAVAMVVGLLSLAAAPAQAAHTAPDSLSVFMPNGAYDDKNQLSDQFDGKDSLAHLTAVASVDADSVTFFVCPDTQTPFNDAGTSVSRNPGCDVIGTDSSGVQPSELDVHGDPTSDEAYEVFWNIPQELDGETRDIFALACQGSEGTADADPNDGVPDNCIIDDEQNIYLEDSSDEDDLISGEITGICTAPGSNINDTTPNAGNAGNRCFNDGTGGSISLNNRPFKSDLAIHGGIVPDDGFTLRFTTSSDVDSATACLAYPANSTTDPVPACVVEKAAASEQVFTTYKQWTVSFTAGEVPDDEEIDLAITGTDNGTVTVAQCSGATNFAAGAAGQCVLDEHYVVSTERAANTLIMTWDADNDGNYENQCANPVDEVNLLLTDFRGGYMCVTDQFDDPFPAVGGTGDFTIESVGPKGSEIWCSGGIMHDHNADGRDEHCHVDENDDIQTGVFYFEVYNYSSGTTTATPGDQTLTGCEDAESPGPAPPANPQANHGCADETVKDSIVAHWQTAPQFIELVFSTGAANPQQECLTGDKFRENQTGDRDLLLVCTFDAEGNFTGTQPAGSGRLQWFIAPSGGGELTATRFTSNPPNETGGDGTETTEIESFRQGNDTITACLQDDPGSNNVNEPECASVQKRVTQGTGVAACNDGQDNDGDGKIDFPADPGCTSANDPSEVDEGGPTQTSHDRNAKITRFRHVDVGKKNPALLVKGKVTVPDGFTACHNQVPVNVQIKTSSGWVTRKSDTTTEAGKFKVLIRDLRAKYRAVAPKFVIADPNANTEDVCRKATSPAKRHRH